MGVLENLRQGLERLEEQRAREQEELERKRARDAELVGKEAAMKVHKGKSTFAETMRTLNRLNSSYRRCYWKSGGEMIFPILYGHMTFASHRCWTVYVKKAVFQAAQAWRRLYGNSVRLAAIKAGGGEIIQHLRQGRRQGSKSTPRPPATIVSWFVSHASEPSSIRFPRKHALRATASETAMGSGQVLGDCFFAVFLSLLCV